MTEELTSLLQEEESHLIKLREIQNWRSDTKNYNIKIGQADRVREE